MLIPHQQALTAGVRLRTGMAPWVAVALSGALVAASAPGLGEVAWLAWIAFVPWLASLPGLTITRAAVSGMAMGLVYSIPGHWATFAAAIGAAGARGIQQELWTLLFFATYAVPFALFAALDRYFAAHMVGLPRTVRALLRASVLAGLICGLWSPFPYTPVVAVVDFIGFVQWASVGGEPLLLTLLLWPGMLLGELFRAPPGWAAATRSVLAMVATLGLLSWVGHARVAHMDRIEAGGGGLRLSMLPLQLDLPSLASPSLIWRDRPAGTQSAVELTRAALQQQPQCDTVVWPELPIGAQYGERACAAGLRLANELGVPLLMQCFRSGERVQMSAEWHRPGQPASAPHFKSSLVPMYEQPLWGGGGLQAGTPGHVFSVDAQRRLVPALCYELYSEAHLRQSVLAGGHFVAHMASFSSFDRHPIDRWDGPMARLRAVAFGLPIARASNRAPAGWIDANGRVRYESARFGRDATCHALWSPSGLPTPYTHVAGRAAALPAVLILSLLLIASFLRRARLRATTPPRRHA